MKQGHWVKAKGEQTVRTESIIVQILSLHYFYIERWTNVKTNMPYNKSLPNNVKYFHVIFNKIHILN